MLELIPQVGPATNYRSWGSAALLRGILGSVQRSILRLRIA